MKLADYSQRVTVDQLDAALRAGGFDGVFHYLAGTDGFALRIEDPAVVAGIRAKGWPQAGIDIPRDPPLVNGAAAAARAKGMYGCPPGFEIYLDIEPARFVLDPAGWARAADVWCDDVRHEGLSPGVYGVDETLAACANHADTVWRAKPGMCDPAGPGLADAFFAGRRIVQCGVLTAGGVEFDVSYSQFTVGVEMFTSNEKLALVHRWYATYLGRLPESEAAMEGWANQLADDRSNVREIQDHFATSDEATAWLAKLNAIRAGTLPPGPPAPHAHSVTVSGTTGAPQ